MVLCDPWDDYRNKYFLRNMKIKQTTLRYNTEPLQGINPMGLCDPLLDTYLHNQKLEELEELS